MPQPPPNAYNPGTKLVVGSHNISIIRYISEGGFAHVYTCNIDPPFQGSKIACLKRVVVPSKWQLSLLRQEVDAMRRLRGNEHIVSYIDSHASRLESNNNSDTSQQQYEVFLLMEYCENNGLIDFMNTRLVNKLTESEIINIFYQVTIGVAMCHHLAPPLIHRDIKIENVLIDSKGTFKLCDFGSSVNYLPPPKTPQELQLLKDDLMQHTTPQYRAPEMIDLTKGFPIDDKSDIWALGIFLYKLCYYTTPFENPQQQSLQDLETCILNSTENLKFKDAPGSFFSHRLKNIIKVCLRADPRRRPNAVQLLGEISSMKGEKSIPNVIPFSVREQLKLKQTPTQIKQKQNVPEKLTEDVKRSVVQDPFASINKKKFLESKVKTTVTPFNGEPIKKVSRPLSAYYDDGHKPKIYSQGNKSSPSIKDYIRNETAKSSEKLNQNFYQDGSTLEFLKSKEEEKLNQRHDTGGSIKSAWNNIRKISSGGTTISANNTGSSITSRRKSLKNILTGNSKKSRSDESINENTINEEPAKLSIQKRMQQLLNNNENSSIQKTAQGYGRFTDNKASDEIDIINSKPKVLAPPKVPKNLSSNRNNIMQKTQPATNNDKRQQPRKPLKSPPKKPTKPKHLKSNENLRRVSDGSEISIPDLDDLEQQFSKKFPSFILE
ncbi:unnamed protein product [Candida verbasci]|uniref:non-specific serine/threonine protein kinase n=1 Tax=Candida verbasci TaxID=1227364 RepID=A0A9W4TT53_9ASCO|nr:unnamed protein product [Candida verbasci]